MATASGWIGKTLGGRYEIQELLGQGGMSAVYKANDPNLRRVVAVKLIHQHLSNNPEFVRRFEEEAAAVAQLRHPNLIQVFDFTHDEDTYFIVFEFVPGETLQARLQRLNDSQRTMDVSDAIDIAVKTADGLHYAHNKGLIHRDIKPANIMLNVYGEPIVMDFGIAKIMGGTQHTATGAVLGTARYMSPEQIKGERIDPRTDIYSLGVTLFEMLGGRAPFEADSAMTLMMMHVTDPVPNLRAIRQEVPAAVVAVVNKALEKDPDKRYQTAAEFAAALRSALDAPGVAAAGATAIETAPTLDPEATIVEPPTAGFSDAAPPSAVDTAAVASAAQMATGQATAPPPTPPIGGGTAVAQGGGNRNLLIGIAAAAAVIIVGALLWFAFRSPGGDEVAGGGGAPTAEVTPTTAPATTDASTATAAPTEEPTPTDVPTDTPEPPDAGQTVGLDSVSGDVVLSTEDGEQPLGPGTAVPLGAGIRTGLDGQIVFVTDNYNSIVNVAPETLMGFDALAEDPLDTDAETIVRLEQGQTLLRKSDPGSQFVIVDAAAEELARVAAPVNPGGAAMAVQVAEDGTLRVSCFEGNCQLGDESPVPVFSEIWLNPDGSVARTAVIGAESPSFVFWQEQCDGCLEEAIASVPTPPAPTATTAATATTAPTATLAATATATLPPDPTATATLAPSPTSEAAQLSVAITNITLNDGGTYVVEYVTRGYTEQLPGQHVHFYWNNISQEQAGVGPNQASWYVYGGPRPFQGWGVNDRPSNATAMCAIVANPDHTAVLNSGNCWNLP